MLTLMAYGADGGLKRGLRGDVRGQGEAVRGRKGQGGGVSSEGNEGSEEGERALVLPC